MGKINPKGEATGTKVKDEEWFSKDVIPTKDAKAKITLSLDTAVKIEVTIDGGDTWLILNSDVALIANSLFNFDVALRVNDKFNMRIPTAGGATINLCRIDEVSGEG